MPTLTDICIRILTLEIQEHTGSETVGQSTNQKPPLSLSLSHSLFHMGAIIGSNILASTLLVDQFL